MMYERKSFGLARLRRDVDGMGLFEVTLIIAAMVMLAAAVAPAMLRSVHERRQSQAEQELAALHAAMVGDDEQGTYGFVGDLGRYPWSLDELVQAGYNTVFWTDESTGVGYGWNGPYVNVGRDARDYATDPWGNSYDVGVVGQGQIRSAGPNGLFDDADDIVFPPNASTPYGSVVISLKGYGDGVVSTDPEGCSVTLYYSGEGTLSYVYDETAPYSFTDVHRGPHAVQVSCPRYDGGTANETAVVIVRGSGQQQFAEIFVELGSTPSSSADTEADTASAAVDESADASEQR